jgi:hypothetical protein
MNKIFSLIESNGRGISNLQKEISTVIQSGEWAPIRDAAEAIAAKYAKDKKGRNTRLSMLRVQMGRACDTLEIARLTVKHHEGAWAVLIVTPKEADEDAKVQRAFGIVEAAAREGGPVLTKLLALVQDLATAKPSDAGNDAAIPESLKKAA